MPLTDDGTALFKAKEGTTQAEIDKVFEFANSLVEKIPCVVSMKSGKATAMALTHGHGFEWGSMAILKSPEDFPAFREHPDHILYALARGSVGDISGEIAKGHDSRLLPMIRETFGETLLFDFEA
jgi:hypothetical protein